MINQLLLDIEEAQARRKSGLVNSIYWQFPNLTREKFFPGWIKGKYYAITSNTSVGKTQFAKYVVLYSTFKSWIDSNKSFDFKIFWFALEESAEDFWLSLIAYSVYLKTKGKVTLSPRILKGQTERMLTDYELNLIRETEQSYFFKTMQEKVEVIDTIFNPTGILKHIEKYFANPMVGKKLYNENGFFSGYEYNNPELYVFGVTDHIRLLHNEKHPQMGNKMTKYETLGFYSQEYCLNKFTRKYGMVKVNIHQQDAYKENMNLYKGQIVEDTLFPSLDHLGSNKEIGQDYDTVVGIYNPYRYGLEDSFGYNYRLPVFNDGRSFRWLGFLKDRLAGLEALRFPSYFAGSNFYFEELPSNKRIMEGDDISRYPKLKI